MVINNTPETSLKPYDINATAQSRRLAYAFELQVRANSRLDAHWASRPIDQWPRLILVRTATLLKLYEQWLAHPTIARWTQICGVQRSIHGVALTWFMLRIGSIAPQDWVLNQSWARRVERATALAAQLEEVSPERVFATVGRQAAAAADGRFDVESYFLLNRLLGVTEQDIHNEAVGSEALSQFREDAGAELGFYWRDWVRGGDVVAVSHALAEAPLGMEGAALQQWVELNLWERYADACRARSIWAYRTPQGTVFGKLVLQSPVEVTIDLQDGRRLTVSSTSMQVRALPVLARLA